MRHASNHPKARLLERREGGDTEEDRAAALLRGSLVPRDPNPAELARIAHALASPVPRRARMRMAFRLAVVFLALIAGGATVKAYELARRAGWLGSHELPPAPLGKPGPSGTTRRRASPRSEAVAAAAAHEVAVTESKVGQDLKRNQSAPPAIRDRLGRPQPLLRTEPALAPAPATASRPAGAPEPAPFLPPAPAPAVPTAPVIVSARPSVAPPASAVAPSGPMPVAQASAPPISDEVRDLDRAVGYLRREQNARAALAALDSYVARYPHGTLQREAQLARIDALLLLKRNDEALRALEGTAFDAGLRSTELLVVRAELRAAKDCRRAEQDFTNALGRGPDARLLERILYGRGACRAELGDMAGVGADVRSYLERFPDGVHAEWARRWLASRPPSAGGRR